MKQIDLYLNEIAQIKLSIRKWKKIFCSDDAEALFLMQTQGIGIDIKIILFMGLGSDWYIYTYIAGSQRVYYCLFFYVYSPCSLKCKSQYRAMFIEELIAMKYDGMLTIYDVCKYCHTVSFIKRLISFLNI